MTFPYARVLPLPVEQRLGDLSKPATIAPLCRIESGVVNGDCVLGVVVVALETLMHGNISTSRFVMLAAELRRQYVKWIIQHWTTIPKHCSMTVNEIVYLNHHIGATDAQRARQDWGGSSEEQLHTFERLGPELLLGEGDLTLISCMLHSITGLSIQFRVWRYQGGFHTYITSCPDDDSLTAGGVLGTVVVDVEHAGSLDSRSAHYKLLVSASLFNLCTIIRNPTSSSNPNPTTSNISAALGDPTYPTSDMLPLITQEAKERNERANAAEMRLCGKRVRS
mgnify:CR=1 FL=1